MKLTINNGRDDCIFNIDEVEAKHNCKYVGEFAIKNKNGCWSEDNCVSVFWQKEPPQLGYSNYFALFSRNNVVYITSGESCVSGEIIGVVAKNNEVIYSRYRHDFRTSTDGSVFIDGGRDYVKTNSGNTISLTILDGEYVDSKNLVILKMKKDLESKLNTKNSDKVKIKI